MRRCLISLFLLLTMAVSATAETTAPPTPEQLILLQQIGFNEDQIRQELAPHGGAYVIGDDQIEQLQEAGFSGEFIEFVRALRPSRRLDNDDIVQMLRDDHTVMEILVTIRDNESAFDTSASAMLTLNRQVELPVAMLKAMQNEPLSMTDLQLLAEREVEVEQQLALLDMLGSTIEIADPASALTLARAGVPAEVLQRLRSTTEASTTEASTNDTETIPVIGTEELRTFRHIAGLFEFSYPHQWYFHRSTLLGQVIYFATPERVDVGTDFDPNKLRTSVGLVLIPRAESGSVAPDPVALLGNTFAKFSLAALENLEKLSEPVALETGGHRAAYQDYQIAFDDTPIRIRDYLIVDNRYLYAFNVRAPADDFPRRQPLFQSLLERFDIADGMSARQDDDERRYTSGELTRRYEQGVVQVLASDNSRFQGTLSSGTGFFVRRDGYLLTNHHVIWSDQENRPYRYFRVRWPDELGLPWEEAELIDYRRSSSGNQGGLNLREDVALLKISGNRPFISLPLTPSEELQPGDPLITIGFPIPEQFDNRVSTTVSSGVVTRFNRDDQDRIETIITDAKIAPGNSGGPAISLVTGGTIGLNTIGAEARAVLSEDRNQRESVGYYGIMPIDRALESFPRQLVVDLERERSMDALDAYDLALYANQRGWREGALNIAREAVRMAPQSPDSHYLLGMLLLAPHPDRDAEALRQGERELDKALELDAEHLPALLLKSEHELNRGEYLAAIKAADQAIEADPNWRAYFQRAWVNFTMQRNDDALNDLEQARRLSGEVVLQPLVLTGQIKYRQEKPEEGREFFEKAVALAPLDVSARLGIGQYYMLKENYFSALVEYDRLNEAVPDNPWVQAALGEAYDMQGDADKAIDHYLKAINLFKENRTPVLEDVYGNAARLAADELLNRNLAVELYANYLGDYYDAKTTLSGHLYLEDQLQDRQRGVRRAHLQRALVLKGSQRDEQREKLEQQFAEVRDASLSQQDIESMKERRYPQRLMVRLIQENPLDITLRGSTNAQGRWDEARQKHLQELANALGVSVALAVAEQVERQERNARNENNQPPDTRTGDNQEPFKYHGTWQYRGEQASAELMLGDGTQYTLTILRNNQRQPYAQGTWQLADANRTLVLNPDNGPATRLPLRTEGTDVLIVTQNGRDYRYQRIR